MYIKANRLCDSNIELIYVILSIHEHLHMEQHIVIDLIYIDCINYINFNNIIYV